MLPHLFPKISRAKPELKASLQFAPRANQARGFVKPSCCVLLPALGPPPRRCLSTVVSQWDPCVLDERPGELNHPWSGVFYQVLLQHSIIWIPQKGCGSLIFPQGSQWLLQILPSPIPAPVSFLTVLVLMLPLEGGVCWIISQSQTHLFSLSV